MAKVVITITDNDDASSANVSIDFDPVLSMKESTLLSPAQGVGIDVFNFLKERGQDDGT